jgi:hypothetical protein
MRDIDDTKSMGG